MKPNKTNTKGTKKTLRPNSKNLKSKSVYRKNKSIKRLKPRPKFPRKTAQERLEEAKSRGVIYLGHLPHGFFEEELREYFSQFGRVTNVKVCRSNKTLKSKGYGFVEFKNDEVAKIAAETMNNYLMFKRRLIAEYIPFEKRSKFLFSRNSEPRATAVEKHKRERLSKNNLRSSMGAVKIQTQSASKLEKRLKKLEKLGVSIDVQPTPKLNL